MANVKKITHLWNATALTLYCIIRREADGYLLNDADGAYASAPADPYISMAEDATIKGMYELSESRAAWDDGKYSIVVYRQAGVSPVPASDIIIGGGIMEIKTDAEVVNTNVQSQDNIDFGALQKASITAAVPSVSQIQSGLPKLTDLADTEDIQSGLATATNVSDSQAAIIAAMPTVLTSAQIRQEMDSNSTKLASILNAVVPTAGSGDIAYTYVLTDDETESPIVGAEVSVSTDSAGANIVASGTTDINGSVTFNLDAGTYYFWRDHPNYSFTDPDTEVVS